MIFHFLIFELFHFYFLYFLLLKKDQDKRHSGFYNFKIDFKEDEKEEKNDKKIIPEQFKVNYLWKKISLIIMFLIILLFIYILFYLYRDIRRKQAKKIIAGFEYSEI